MSPLAVYVHTPFCPSKCGYCDFNSYAMEGEIMVRTTDATIAEIRRSPAFGRPAKTIFFGGGTPTYLPERELVRLLEAVLEAHPPLKDCEITSEANPGTVDSSKFLAMKRAGFNRVSLGAQSFVDGDLLRLGRVHQAGHVEAAVGAARAAGFRNLNLDLMFALPGQSARAWQSNLDRAIALRPEHLSLYCLTIEPNTAFYKEQGRGELVVPEDEAQVEMYDMALEAAASAGYEQYEISNFALAGKECRHNLAYWRGEEYAGYGPGAVGCLLEHGRPVRTTNIKHPVRYCDAVEEGQATDYEREVLSPDARRLENIMLGLRLNSGFELPEVSAPALERVRARGWVKVEDGRICLTENGRHFCSEVALELA